MMNFPFKRLREREQVPAKEWNMLCDLVARLMADSATTRDDVAAISEAEPFRARIVGREDYEDGQSPVYSWVASRQDAEGNPSQNPIAMSGDANGYPAYEEEGNPLVPIDGTVEVEMRLGPGPYYLFNYKSREVWAKLTGSSGALYAWTEVYHAGGTTFSTMTGGRSGTTSINAARERNGVTGIANDTIVRIERGHCDGAPRVIVTRQQVGDGEETSEIQEIRILDAAGGTFTLTHEGQTTAAIDYDADATAINDALEALSNITNVDVTGAGTSGDPFVVTFEDDFDEHAFLQPDGGELLSDQEWLFVSPTSSASYDPVDGGTISVSQNNYQLTSTVTFIDVDTTINFTGFVAPGGGKSEVVYVKNVGSKVATFVHESASSTAANRFHCPTQSDYQLPPQSIGVFKYDTIGLRWQPVLNIPTYAAYTKTQITSDQNDYALSEYAHIYRVSTDASRTVTGFADGFPGRLLILENVGSNNLVLANQSASSTAANRVITSTGASLTLGADQGAFIVYDGASSRWRVIAHTASGSGITSLNGLTAATQTFAVGTAGTDFAVSSSTSTHTFNLPDAYNTTRGVVSDGTQVFAGTKVFAKSYIMIGTDGFTEYGSVGPGSGTADHVWVQHQTSAPYVGLGIQDYSEGDAEFQVWGPGNSLHADGIAVMTGSPNGGHSVNGPAFGVLVEGPIYRVGVYGTGGAGDKYAGGICYELGSGGVSIGDAVGSGTANYVLFVDGSGNLAQSSDFQWDDTAKSLTLGTSGYLVTTKSSAPSGIATGAIAGPFTTS